MSEPAIRSNRGDVYQTLIAFDWALTVFYDSDYQWLEIDSTTYDVDDVVIGKADGTSICCQCKKNQPHFKAWSLVDLADELDKAYNLLLKYETVEILFYSRDSFGKLAKLKEYRNTQPDESGYYKNLPANLKKTETELSKQIAAHALKLSAYEFLAYVDFEVSTNYNRLIARLRERLQSMVSSSNAVYDALYRHLDQLGARVGNGTSVAAQHRLTKDDLRNIISSAGGIISSPVASEDIKSTFVGTSNIGRHWRSDIAGRHLDRPVLNELLSAIDSGHKSILLTGLPGSGKTCVMLALQKELEQRAQKGLKTFPLFIQSREFADLTTAAERADLGLPEQWVEYAARLAENVHVVVVIDSLDVLSIAREHKILTYFLAQLDRLLIVPNITVITACRDFDRRYDRRIAERQWDCEFKCGLLDWDSEVKPLLETINIETDSIKAETRELIRNTRELALFVELAQRERDCNVITSQALAQRYLDVFIRDEPALGEDALVAIEGIADEMLKTRKLTIPYQRVSIPETVKRRLCSLNIIQETKKGDLTFGHQTLFDVLVISGLLRKGCTLNQFINELPPVPFVRPCIRSFLEQLALGDRREYRKQLRAVLTGSSAFHIRRLVAESLAEQIPQDEDWPLIQELRNNHKEVFQVVYYQSNKLEWFYFWDKHWVPLLFAQKDVDGINRHLAKISLWINKFPKGVLDFCTKALEVDYIDQGQLIWQLSFILERVDDKLLDEAAPLLEKLLYLPRVEHNPLGKTLARYVSAEVISDATLWQYIAGEIRDEDIMEYDFHNKLHCQSYELESKNNNFLPERMVNSVTLLDLALNSIEHWSRIKSSHYKIHSEGYGHFLHMTSYQDKHSRHDDNGHKNSARILFDAIEKAIINHAQLQSEWWLANSKRVCFNCEGALRYLGILACMSFPLSNRSLIGSFLTDKKMLESMLSYELGLLIKTTFIYLDTETQDAVMQTILLIREDDLNDENNTQWVLRERAELIAFIPCFLRSPETQSVLYGYEKANGTLIQQPYIYTSGSRDQVPFSFDKFLSCRDIEVLKLINHYSGYDRAFDDRLIGGEDEVGMQLREASSRQPIRFLHILPIYWNDIPARFRDDIMDGVATHVAYLYGDLKTNDKWEPLEKPEGVILANQILDELERHSGYWYHNRAASSAIEACSHVIEETLAAARLTFLCLGYANYNEEQINEEKNLITAGINMVSGHIVEAVMILTNNLQEKNIEFPDLLIPTLFRFSRSRYKAHQALILRRLPYVQSKNGDLGWQLFHEVMKEPSGLWTYSEHCLYYAYHRHVDQVEPILDQIYCEGIGKDLETWGRISALVSFADSQKQADLLTKLKTKNSIDAWEGAAQVWSHPENIQLYRTQCFSGLEAGLNEEASYASVVAHNVTRLFHEDGALLLIPEELLQLCFDALKNDSENKNHSLFGFSEWLNKTSQHDPKYALIAAEKYLNYTTKLDLSVEDYHNNFTQLITRLFAEAEEQEEIDNGEMLQRVVALQDILLARGVRGIDEWLKAAERP